MGKYKSIKRYLYHNQAWLMIVLLIVISCLVFWFVSTALLKRAAQLTFFADWGYEYVYYCNSPCGEIGNYAYTDGDVVLHEYEHSEFEACTCKINAISVMTLPNQEYNANFDLASDEVAISKNLAVKYKLECGDSVYCQTYYSSAFKKYIVKTIFGYSYGISDIDYSDDAGVVVLGYNEKIINSQTQYIWLTESESSDYFSHNVGSLLSVDKVHDDKISSAAGIGGCIVLYFIVHLIVIGIYHKIVTMDYIGVLKKSMIYGEKLRTLRIRLFCVLVVPSGAVAIADLIVLLLWFLPYAQLSLVSIGMIFVGCIITLTSFYLVYKKRLHI